MKKSYLFIILFALFIISLFIDEYASISIVKIRPPILTKLMIIVSNLATITSMAVIAIILSLSIVYSKRAKKYLPGMIISLIVSSLLVVLIKDISKRPRPFIGLGIEPLENKSNYSFPSGHANSVFSLIPFINIYFKKFRYIWIIFAILVSFSRVYLGVHYLSDVIFSMILGLSISYLFIYIENKYNISRLLNIKK